jgi:hypothetical protein
MDPTVRTPERPQTLTKTGKTSNSMQGRKQHQGQHEHHKDTNSSRDARIGRGRQQEQRSQHYKGHMEQQELNARTLVKSGSTAAETTGT